MKKIGEHLLETGMLSQEAIERALRIQESTGSMLGQILQAEGMISSYHFYEELAKFKNIPFVNLEEYKIKEDIMLSEEKDDYIEMQFIPFDAVNKVVYIATTNPSKELDEYLDKNFHSYKIFVTSPFDILWTLQRRFNKEYSDAACDHLFENLPESSSKNILNSTKVKRLICLLCALFVYAIAFKGMLIPFLVLMNVFFFLSILSKITFFTVGFSSKEELNKAVDLNVEDKELPVYSILVPLYHEKENTIKKLIKSLNELDYPKDKLDIKLIVEINDNATVNTIKNLRPFSGYQIIKVPENYPKTKPKACNYALHFCKGEYVTIYDAEDCPDPQQLKKVIAKFSAAGPNLACVQARLNYYNRKENILTQLFSLEYASWFDYILYGLQKLDIPIPLGGTSNHFRIKILKSLYAWDPYNVTEDADLGVRLSIAGLKTAIVDSITLEEAPITLKPWIKQRSRWIKGYFQTYIVHMRHPFRLLKNLGIKRFVGFFFFVGAPGLVYFSLPIVFILMIAGLNTSAGLPVSLVMFSYFCLALTLATNFLIAIYIAIKNKWKDCAAGVLFFPVYWILHCIASFESVYQLIRKPHHWNKTEHGVSKFVE